MSDSRKTELVEVPPLELTPASSLGGRDVARRQSKFDAALLRNQDEIARTPEDAYDAILAQILSAESPDKVLTPVESIEADQLIGLPLTVHSFEWVKSEYDVGSPMYAAMKVTRQDTGETTNVNCGHKKVLAQLIRLTELDALPFDATFVQQGTSRVGTPLLILKKIEPMTAGPVPF